MSAMYFKVAASGIGEALTVGAGVGDVMAP
jgi:hypothetical protein